MERDDIPGPDVSAIRELRDWSSSSSDAGHTVVDRISPEEFARGFVRRPGMYLGSTSFERALGYVLGLEAPLLQACRTPEDVASLPTSRHSAVLQRDPADDEQAAIARLEPLLVEILTELEQTGDEV